MSLFLLRCSLYLYEAHFVLQYPLYNSITYKFQSLFWECSIRKEVSSRYFNWLFSQASNRFHKGYHTPPLWRTSQFDNILMYCWSHEPFDFPNLKIKFVAFRYNVVDVLILHHTHKMPTITIINKVPGSNPLMNHHNLSVPSSLGTHMGVVSSHTKVFLGSKGVVCQSKTI